MRDFYNEDEVLKKIIQDNFLIQSLKEVKTLGNEDSQDFQENIDIDKVFWKLKDGTKIMIYVFNYLVTSTSINTRKN